MNAEIIAIGTELTAGITLDTNGAWLARRLTAIGAVVNRHVAVADRVEEICDAVVRAARDSDVVIVNGGLGPTADDLTREALAQASRRPLVHDADSEEHIRSFFKNRNREISASNFRQAELPEGATVLHNECGTAPGFRIEINGATVYVLPGVPVEMKQMYERCVEPELTRAAAGAATVIRTIHCFGDSESAVGERIADLMAAGRQPTVGITAKDGVLSVRVIARSQSRESAQALAAADAANVRQRLGDIVFGEDDDTLHSVVGQLLIEQNHTIATAESCTGGLLAKLLTDLPGSSAFFLAGLVTYSNEAKTRLLSVPEETITTHGAVSAEVAAAMAEGCRNVTGATIAVSTTGIAGPSGGTPTKPVGLIYAARADADGTIVKEINLGKHLTRDAIRDRTCKRILNYIRLYFSQD